MMAVTLVLAVWATLATIFNSQKRTICNMYRAMHEKDCDCMACEKFREDC